MVPSRLVFNQLKTCWRDIYIWINSSLDLSLSFCATWVVVGEHLAAARAVTVVHVIQHFLLLTQSKRPKNNKSYDTMVKHHIYSLMLVKIQFFKDIASLLQTYLTSFRVMHWVIVDKMVQLFTKIMLEEASTDYKQININITKKGNRMESATIRLPTATTSFFLKSSSSKEKKIKVWGYYNPY